MKCNHIDNLNHLYKLPRKESNVSILKKNPNLLMCTATTIKVFPKIKIKINMI